MEKITREDKIFLTWMFSAIFVVTLCFAIDYTGIKLSLLSGIILLIFSMIVFYTPLIALGFLTESTDSEECHFETFCQTKIERFNNNIERLDNGSEQLSKTIL